MDRVRPARYVVNGWREYEVMNGVDAVKARVSEQRIVWMGRGRGYGHSVIAVPGNALTEREREAVRSCAEEFEG